MTKAFPGGEWLTRALRAVPVLQQVRLKSHREMANYFVDLALEREPGRDRAAAYQEARLSIELGYAAIEMVLEEESHNVRSVMRATARATATLSQDQSE